MIEPSTYVTVAVWGWIGFVCSSVIFAFAMWFLHDGFVLGKREEGRGEGNKAFGLVLLGIMGIIIVLSLWHLEIIV